jgi:hypothetical protein
MRADCHLKALLMWNLNDLHDSAKLMVLGSYGLAYCYISSIPILVLHAARSLLPLQPPANEVHAVVRWLRNNSVFFVTIFLWLILVAALFLPVRLLDSKNLDSSIAHGGFWLFLAMFTVPLLLIVLAILYRKQCYAFYSALAEARASQADAGELVTSYRHLREHGNSIFIVLLEGVLGLTLFSAFRASQQLDSAHTGLAVAPQFYLYGLVGLLWILPGALVWFFATLIEREFIKANREVHRGYNHPRTEGPRGGELHPVALPSEDLDQHN